MEEPETTESRSFEMPLPSWRLLFTRLAAGDADALENVYDASARILYGLAVWRTGSQEDAADVVQQVFLRLAERRHRLTEVENPRGWLLAVTHRIAVDLCRRRSVRNAESLDRCAFLISPRHDIDLALDAEKASRLAASLPPKQRAVIYLHHYAGQTFEEIGRVLGIPQFTAASRYRLGIAKLRDLMEGNR